MAGKILLVVHQAHSDPGRVAQVLRAQGYDIDLCRHACGDPLPPSLEAHAGVVIFGGPMSANDDAVLPFLRAELDWIARPLRAGKPFLGICLGAQLLARHLGAAVGPHAAGWHEIGYYPVRATAAGRGLFAAEQHFYQWHGEGFGLPHGAELLAEGTYFPNQAFRYGNAYGVQFHPEVTEEIMRRWSAKAVHRMVLPGAQPREAHLAGGRTHDAKVAEWLGRFLGHWLRGDLSLQAPPTQARTAAADGASLAAS